MNWLKQELIWRSLKSFLNSNETNYLNDQRISKNYTKNKLKNQKIKIINYLLVWIKNVKNLRINTITS